MLKQKPDGPRADKAPILVAVTEEGAATAIDIHGGEGRKGQWEAGVEMMSKYTKECIQD